MSVGIGWAANGFVVLACDRQSGYDSGVVDTQARKMVRAGSLAGVATGSVRGRDILLAALRGAVELGPRVSAETLHRLLSDQIEHAGWQPHHDRGAAPAYNFSCLVTDGRAVFEVDPSLTVSQYDRYHAAAVGTGASVALGAWHALRGVRRGYLRLANATSVHLEIARAAVHASNHYLATCGGTPVTKVFRPGRTRIVS